MIKRILSTMMLLTSLLGGSISTALAANSAKAIWCESNKTLYFVYDDNTYSEGGNYNSIPITYCYNIYTGVTYIQKKGSCTNIFIENNFADARLSNLSYMFSGFNALTSVEGLKNLITASATNLSCMFQNCSNLTAIDFTDVNTSNVTSMENMFSGCSSLTSLDLSSFNTGESNTEKVTSMASMFEGCTSLNTLTLGNFKTGKVTNMSRMFYNCQSLTSLDLRGFDTSEVTNMSEMFDNCKVLTSIDVSSFNTSLVTDMSSMFYHCDALTSLDVNNFDVTNVTKMPTMFAYASNLVTIFCNNDWNHDGLTSSNNMFNECRSLKNGTIVYNSSNTSATYANPTTGYFTRNTVVMSFSPATNQRATVGTEFTEPTLTTGKPITVTYSSSDPTVATVIETTGEVTPLSTGSTTITALYAGEGSTLLPNSASYTLTVSAKEFTASIGGINLTSDHINVTNKLTEALGLSTGTVSLKSNSVYSELELTLNNAVITMNEGSFSPLSNSENMSIVLEGNNTITSTTTVPLQNHGSLTISGTGTLTLSGDTHGIDNYKNIILNSGTLDVTGTTIGYHGTDASSNLTINGGVLMATGGTASIRASGTMDLGEGVDITQPLGAQKGTGEIWDVVDASGHTITSKVTIAKGAVAAGLAYSATEGTATYGVAPTGLPTLTNTHSLPITYTSSNPNVATVASDGNVTIVKPGTATITASFEGSATYLAASASYTLTVNKATPEFAFSETEAKATYGDTPNVQSLTTNLPEDLRSSISYSSTLEDIATVGADKKIQIKKKGLTYIQASYAGNEYYKAADAQYKLTIKQATATLTFGESEVNAKVAVPFASPAVVTSPSGLPVKYSSDLPDVAGVDETTGKVTPKQEGTAIITGTVDTDQYYGTKTYQVTITKKANDLAFEKTEVSAVYGDVFTPPTLVNPHELGVNYSSSNTDVATVHYETGAVTFITTGEVDIKANFVGTGEYVAGSATYHLTITKKKAALAFAQPTATATYSAAFTELALTNPNSLTVTYESSEPTVATVATDGKVTVLKAGETTISAKFAGNGIYEASTVSYVLTVNPKTVSSPTITLSATSFTYDGTAKQPTVTVKDGSTTIPASEYTVGYSNNTNVGTATVTITDKAGGNYTVSGTTTFAIAAADGSLTPPVGKTGLVFSGTAQNLITAGSSTTGTVQYSLDGTTYGTAIPQGTDAKEYTIYYKVVAKAGYKDVAPASFKVTISPKTVSSPSITLSATTFVYDGSEKKPTVTVKDGSTTIPTSEYTVGYSNNKNVGIATVIITDKAGGNYTVSGTTTFVIVLRGDANGDNKVNVADIVAIVNHKKGIAVEGFDANAADVNGDSSADEKDIELIQKIILGE